MVWLHTGALSLSPLFSRAEGIAAEREERGNDNDWWRWRIHVRRRCFEGTNECGSSGEGSKHEQGKEEAMLRLCILPQQYIYTALACTLI